LKTSVPFELLETMRWTPREGWYLLDRHLARLEASARHFQFVYSASQTRDTLDRAVRSAETALRVRLLLAANGTIRVEQTPLDRREGVWRVRLAADPVDPSDEFLFTRPPTAPSTRRACRPDCDDVIQRIRRAVTETTITGLVVEMDLRRHLWCLRLPGHTARRLLATSQIGSAGDSGGTEERGPFWLVNSVRGWCAGG
jgi:para-aminobenzoate synthetase/4-amino-4-deoxychorismate lyase